MASPCPGCWAPNAIDWPTTVVCRWCRVVWYCSETCELLHRKTAHAALCNGFNYEIQVYLCEGVVTHPPILRILSVPGGITFHELHHVMLRAFQWELKEDNYEFRVEPSILEIHDQPRRVSHVRQWKSKETYLAEVWEPESRGPLVYEQGVKVKYQHSITLVRKVPAERRVALLGGMGHWFAENASLEDWTNIRELYHQTELNQFQRVLKQWYEGQCPNGDTLGLGHGRVFHYNKDTIQAELNKLDITAGCRLPEEALARIEETE